MVKCGLSGRSLATCSGSRSGRERERWESERGARARRGETRERHATASARGLAVDTRRKAVAEADNAAEPAAEERETSMLGL
jgi:hypothetical protein